MVMQSKGDEQSKDGESIVSISSHVKTASSQRNNTLKSKIQKFENNINNFGLFHKRGGYDPSESNQSSIKSKPKHFESDSMDDQNRYYLSGMESNMDSKPERKKIKIKSWKKWKMDDVTEDQKQEDVADSIFIENSSNKIIGNMTFERTTNLNKDTELGDTSNFVD